MAYSDDISNLNADHHWDFDGDSLDQIGSANGTDTSMLYTSSAIAKDATYCAETNATTDRVSIPTTTDINNSAQNRKAVAGWFMVTAIQNPPKNIYGEGDGTQAFRFILGWGNYLMFEVDDPSFTLQIFGDVPLAVNRPYHLCMIFEGNGYSNEVRAFLDGVEQLNASPLDREPDAATLTARSVPEFGDPAGTVAVGGTAVILIAPINGKWNHWATWDGADAVLTDTEVRETLFERGALADVTISSGTESAMQTALDVYADTLRGDAPCCIEIEAVSGGGDFELTLDNITFNDLASIHIRYNGTANTLTLINTNGANCSITSAPFGGSITLLTEVDVTITVKDLVTTSVIVGARVYIEADSGGDLSAGTEILNTTTNASGIATTTFNYGSSQPIVGVVRKGSSTYYRQGEIVGSIESTGLDQLVLMIQDE